MARGDRDKAAARRRAALQRAADKTGRPNRDATRERAEALASIGPSAGRVLVLTDDGPRSVDPVATAVALARDVLPRSGAGSDVARDRAGLVHRALTSVPTPSVPSGLTLTEALAIEGALPRGTHDGTVTVLEHLRDLGERHERGEVDLYARVAPLGMGRHPRADEIEVVCRALVPEEQLHDAQPSLVLLTDDGWLEVWPPAAMDAASMGLLVGELADAVGEGLYRWLTGPQARAIAAGGPTALPDLFRGADVVALVETSAQRAGSDHPVLAGPVLMRMLAPPPPSS